MANTSIDLCEIGFHVFLAKTIIELVNLLYLIEQVYTVYLHVLE